MPLEDGQYQIRDLMLGRGTPFRVTDDTNFFSRSNRSTGGAERAWSDGSWAGAQFRESMVIPITIVIDADSKEDALGAIDALHHAFRPVHFGADVELRYNVGNGERLFIGRPIMCEADPELIGVGAAVVTAAFEVNDPYAYSGEEYAEEGMTLPEYLGGHTVPFVVPFTISGYRVGGEAEVEYTGTRPAGMRIVWEVPVGATATQLVNPSIVVINEDDELTRLTVDLTLTPGEFLEVDTATKSVMLNGHISRRGQAIMQPVGQFPILYPGTNRVRFRGSDQTRESTMSVYWRRTWY